MKIHDCAARGNIDGVRAELCKGVPVDARDENDFTPLARAAESPDADEQMLRLLVAAGANVNAVVEEGKEFPLSLAAGAGDLKRLTFLLQSGANVNQVTDAGYSALLHAMYRLGDSDDLVPVARLLIQNGATVDHRSDYGEIPLNVASSRDRFDVVRVLLEAGADLRPLHWTELMRGVAIGSLDDVKTQIALNRELTHRDHFDRTPFLLATAAGDTAKAKLLLERGANLEDEVRGGGTAVTRAAEKGDRATLKWLIECGARVNAVNDMGDSPLLLAARQGSADCVELLLKAGADLDHKNEFGHTAMSDASSEAVVRLLVADGADIDAANAETRRKLVGLTGDKPLNVSQAEYLSQRSPRFGNANPAVMEVAFWREMVRSGISAYGARQQFGDTDRLDGPVWCFDRFGTSFTALPDGRYVQIAGEHEDYYDPDFNIYNDVIAHDGPGRFQILGYPQEVFPPTDFHSATYIDGYIYIIGGLGYRGTRQFGFTPVYRLNCATWAIEPVPTHGECPGWIYKHQAKLSDGDCIMISAGEICVASAGGEEHVSNEARFCLQLSDGRWRRL